jgi:pyruvate-formate lyase-activating enzyme
MIPNKNNFCGGNFTDWLEVMLTEKCNGKCSWCVEKRGWHPEEHASLNDLIKAINESGKINIILLGGEPLLYKDIGALIDGIANNKKIYVTTNGSLLSPDFVHEKLSGLTGLNISIHHYDLLENEKITGILLEQDNLENTIIECRKNQITVRFNCNLIRGNIDTERGIATYIQWAKTTGADKVRFAELKFDEGKFVDLAHILNYQYGLNDNPFIEGCNKEAVISGMPVNFRQMCGLQTAKRVRPMNPKGIGAKQVLYYDGKFYDGWQQKEEGGNDEMTEEQVRRIIREELRNVLAERRSNINYGRENEDAAYNKILADRIRYNTYKSIVTCQY